MSEHPRAFISYARRDGEAFANTLRSRLEREESEISLWQDRTRLEGGVGWWKQITDALDNVDFLILIMTPAAVRSPIAAQEWRYARQRGVCVYPVKGVSDAELDYASLPQWMRKAHFFDLAREWDTFVGYLKSPCQAARVPFMAPDLPMGYVERPQVIERLVGQLLAETREAPVTAALHGPGGIGKTTLAVAVCHREEVVSAFDDGILWVTLGQNPNVRDALTKLYAALTGERPAFLDEEDAAFTLSERLEDKNCLIVIDDVWDPAHLAPFLRGGRGCTRLLTTRRYDIAAETSPLAVEPMSHAEATQLLAARLPEHAGVVWPLQELTPRLGNWPLLLELANAALRQRMSRGDTMDNALLYLRRKLDQEGVFAFDQANAGARNRALARAIEISLAPLEPLERERCQALAVFSDNIDIPVEQAGRLWGCDQLEAEERIERFDSLSLLRLNLPTRTFRFHEVMRSYLRRQIADPAALHGRLVDAWGDPRRLADDFAWRWLPFHLVAAGRSETLRSLLLDFDWLQAKLAATDVMAVVADLGLLASDPEAQMVRGAVCLAAHVLVQDKTQLAGQLIGRLGPRLSSNIDVLRESASNWRGAAWLRPLEACLAEPGGPLLFTLTGHKEAIRTVAVTADGRRAVSGSDDGTVRVWDLERGVEDRVLGGHSDWVRAIALLRHGSRVASTGDDGTICLWDFDSGNLVKSVEVPGQRPRALAVLPDGICALVAGEGRAVALVDLEKGKVVRALRGHAAAVNAVAVCEDGGRGITASDDRTVRVWELIGGGEPLVLRGHRSKVVAAAISADGRFAVTAASDGSLRWWALQRDPGASSSEGRVITSAAYWVRTIALSPDGTQAITGSDDGSLRAWDIERGTLTRIFEGHSGRIHAVATTPDGGRAVSASQDRTLKVWDLRSGGPRRARKGHDDRIRALVSTGDGRLAVSTSVDQKLKVWDLHTLGEVATYGGYAPNPIALTRDGRYLVCASSRQYAAVQVVDLMSGKVQHVLKGHTDVLRALAVSDDGRRLASASDDGSIRLWDLDSGEALMSIATVWSPDSEKAPITIPTGRHWVRALGIAPDGRYVISGSEDRTLMVWDLHTGGEALRLAGHGARINSVAVSPDGETAISASADNTLKVWELTRGVERVSLLGHEAAVNWVAVEAVGGYVASVADDCTVRIWRIADGTPAAVFTGESPMTACALGREGMLVAGDQSGGLHFLQMEKG